MLVYARKKLCKQRPCVYSEHFRFFAESDTSRDVAHNLLVSGAPGFRLFEVPVSIPIHRRDPSAANNNSLGSNNQLR